MITTGLKTEREYLLSAVVGLTILGVACGVGTFTRRLLFVACTSELDFLKPVSGGLGAASLP